MSPSTLCGDDDGDAGDEIDLAAMLEGSRKKKKKKRATSPIDHVIMNSKQSSSSVVMDRNFGSNNNAEDASSSSSSSSGGDDNDIDDSCCSSTDGTVESDESLQLTCHNTDPYTAHVRSWVNHVPIGLGLCPWAMKSRRLGRLYYKTCQGTTPSDVALLVRLSHKEREQALHDIHGVADIVQETPNFVAKAMNDLEFYLIKHQHQNNKQSSAFQMVWNEVPSYVRSLYLKFLRCDEFDIPKAGARIYLHFDTKLWLFGRDKLCKDITMADFDKDDTDCYRAGFFVRQCPVFVGWIGNESVPKVD